MVSIKPLLHWPAWHNKNSTALSINSLLSLRLIETLRGTLAQVEQTSGLAPDDPSLDALKRILLVKIADLEVQRTLGVATPEGAGPAAALDSLPAVTPPASEFPE